MFQATAETIRAWLDELPLDESRVANVGSSNAEFYKVRQPWIWEHILEPLAARGAEVVNVDPKGGAGVDCAELTLGIPFDLLMCCSVLEHVEGSRDFLTYLGAFIRRDGWLLLDVPGDYPYHADPIDNGLRIRTREEYEALLGSDYEVVNFRLVTSGPHSAALVLARKVA